MSSLQSLSSVSASTPASWGFSNGTPWLDGTAPPASFDTQVRGQESRSLDLDMAHMSQDVYERDSAGVQGWSRLDASALSAAGIEPAALEDSASGFRAAVYTDGADHYTLAFAGSGDLPDWLTNFEQGLGLNAAQYNEAVALAKDAKLAFGDQLAITGHSLGGGLASAAALATGSPAVTFNAAGLNDKTIERIGLDPAQAQQDARNGQIRRYAVNGELLTSVQEKVPLVKALAPDALGYKIELNAPQETSNPVSLHRMGSVLEALNTDHPWLH